MTTPLPEAPWATVRARLTRVYADSSDDGDTPDWIPAAGTRVTLIPSVKGIVVYDNIVKTMALVQSVDCVIEDDGFLKTTDGLDVKILSTNDTNLSVSGWTWTANIPGQSPIVFTARAGEIVDLSDFVKAPAVDSTKQWVARIPELVELFESMNYDLSAYATRAELNAAVGDVESALGVILS